MRTHAFRQKLIAGGVEVEPVADEQFGAGLTVGIEGNGGDVQLFYARLAGSIFFDQFIERSFPGGTGPPRGTVIPREKYNLRFR